MYTVLCTYFCGIHTLSYTHCIIYTVLNSRVTYYIHVFACTGAGMFVTTIVTGAVSIYKPFTLTQRPFMRDVVFYIFAVYLTFFVLWTNTVELYQAISK